MALILNFNVYELPDSSGFVFVETTGPYSVSNLGGWSGGGNPNWSTAYWAEITIYDSLGNVVGGVVDIEYPFTDFDSAPTSTVWSTPKMTILASNYNTPTFIDGVYRIVYTARQTASGTVLATTQKYVLLDSQFQNNMKNAELQYPTCGCSGNIAVTLCTYRSLDLSCFFLVESGNYTTAQELITQLVIDTANICNPC